MWKPNVTEIFLIQIIIYSILWLTNDYIATLLTTSFTAICALILFVSIIAEWIEPSKVPKWYFQLMGVSILAPIVTAMFFVIFLGLGKGWMDKF